MSFCFSKNGLGWKCGYFQPCFYLDEMSFNLRTRRTKLEFCRIVRIKEKEKEKDKRGLGVGLKIEY